MFLQMLKKSSKISTTKRVTVGITLINKLSGALIAKQYIINNNEFLKWSDNRRVMIILNPYSASGQ